MARGRWIIIMLKIALGLLWWVEKTGYFSTSVEGAKASANLYSLVESAKANNLEPSAYLKTVFTLLPQAKTLEDVEALLPWNINKVVG